MKKKTMSDLDPRIEALENAGRVYTEAQNRGVDQELWDKFGSAPLKVSGGSYVPFPEKYTDVVSDGGLDPRNSALDVQIGGGHYKSYAIQPVEFIHKNKIPYIEGCAIKYLCRWREKGGIEDLKKARHYIELLIDLEGHTQ
jgi:hypothetical protein